MRILKHLQVHAVLVSFVSANLMTGCSSERKSVGYSQSAAVTRSATAAADVRSALARHVTVLERHLGAAVAEGDALVRRGHILASVKGRAPHRVRVALKTRAQKGPGDATIEIEDETAGVTATMDVADETATHVMTVGGQSQSIQVNPDGTVQVDDQQFNDENDAGQFVANGAVLPQMTLEMMQASIDMYEMAASDGDISSKFAAVPAIVYAIAVVVVTIVFIAVSVYLAASVWAPPVPTFTVPTPPPPPPPPPIPRIYIQRHGATDDGSTITAPGRTALQSAWSTVACNRIQGANIYYLSSADPVGTQRYTETAQIVHDALLSHCPTAGVASVPLTVADLSNFTPSQANAVVAEIESTHPEPRIYVLGSFLLHKLTNYDNTGEDCGTPNCYLTGWTKFMNLWQATWDLDRCEVPPDPDPAVNDRRFMYNFVYALDRTGNYGSGAQPLNCVSTLRIPLNAYTSTSCGTQQTELQSATTCSP